MFSLAAAHELTHLFVGYLAQGSDDYDTYTPPRVTYLNYGGSASSVLMLGESGRYLESTLFGGSLEFYWDVEDDAGQV